MVNAINNKVNYRESNTEVIIKGANVFVRLYDTYIYAKVRGKVYFSDGGFNTATTSSRLRALGAQTLGVDINLVIVLLNHFEHPVFGLFGIAAVFVEHAGNRGNRHAGKLGDIDHRNLFVFHVFHSRRKVLKNPVKLSNRLLTMPVYSENSQKSICF